MAPTRPALLLGLLAMTGCVKDLPSTMAPLDSPQYRTDDGWTLDLRHYPGEGPPVVLVHGMGANHYNWDYRQEVSLAAYLQEQGWDVWVPELRGDQGASAPSKSAARNFSFDDHANYDLPAAIDEILDLSNEEQVYWVGHSMGGMLLYTALSLYPEKIAAGVGIGAPVHFREMTSLHRWARRGGYLIPARGQLHNKAFYRMSRLAGRANPLYGILSNRDNLDWDLTRNLAEDGLENMSRQTVKQVHGWMRTQEFTTVDGEPWVEPSSVPLLVLAGSVDQVSRPSTVEAACSVYVDCEFRLLGTETGLSTDYGHVDPVIGTTARAEVYPLIETWLQDHRVSDPPLTEP